MTYYVIELIDEMDGLKPRRNVAARAGEEIARPPQARCVGVLAHYDTADEARRGARKLNGEPKWTEW